MLRVGQAMMRPVVEIDELRLPPRMFVSGITPGDVAPHADVLCPQYYDPATHEARLSQHAWLIEIAGARILVDPCVGHRRHRPLLPFYDMIDSPLLDRLEALGAPPESIDFVFCTHLHLDHVGWNTREEDGRFVPTFPNARYLFSAAEDAYWGSAAGNAEAFNAGVYEECIAPVKAAGLAQLVEPGFRFADGLMLIDAAGHTIGHLAGVLESGGEGALLAGDAFHHPLQVLFPQRRVPAHDEEQARRTRMRLLDLCVERDYWLAPAHFRAPHACKLRRRGDGFEMVWA